jgi:hypothetical protein
MIKSKTYIKMSMLRQLSLTKASYYFCALEKREKKLKPLIVAQHNLTVFFELEMGLKWLFQAQKTLLSCVKP